MDRSGSRWVVLVALGGNLAVGALKFAAFAITGSTAMMTEGIHSLVDTCDQLLLLVGQARADRPADDAHPFGFGMETYFWGFVVALMVFFAGGAAAVWEGIEKVISPGRLVHPGVSLAVLAGAAVFELVSFRSAYREYRRVVRGRRIHILRFVIISKDPSLFATLLEDLASMAGLAIAAAGVIGTAYLGLAWSDAAASIGIGLLLLATAILMANETRSLIAGEAAAPPIVERLAQALREAGVEGELLGLRTLHLGPNRILTAVNWRFPEHLDRAQVRDGVETLCHSLSAADERVCEVLFEPPRNPSPKGQKG
ncbi:MAG: cation transporter [Caulobacteraceae bacterium]|nr:cation transporter [Caulobacteraceae bacterium]